MDLWEQHGLLQAMYSGDLERCAFQQMALITRAAALQKALATDATLIITERSLESDRACFAQINLTKPCEVAAYAVTHDAVTSTFPPARHATILLEAPIAVTSERIRLRGRNAETQDEDGEAGVPDECGGSILKANDRAARAQPRPLTPSPPSPLRCRPAASTGRARGVLGVAPRRAEARGARDERTRGGGGRGVQDDRRAREGGADVADVRGRRDGGLLACVRIDYDCGRTRGVGPLPVGAWAASALLCVVRH